MEPTTVCAFALLIGCFAVYVWHVNRQIKDNDARAWATACQPFFVHSRHYKDTTVSQEANYIREQLKIHGNKLLMDPQTGGYENAVIEEVFLASVVTTSADFDIWLDGALIRATKEREAWRAKKLSYNMDAAKQHFGGQTITVQHSAN